MSDDALRAQSLRRVPAVELAHLFESPAVGVAYMEFLLRLREIPNIISGGRPTQLTREIGALDASDLRWPPDRRKVYSEFRVLNAIARANRGVVSELAGSYLAANEQVRGLVRDRTLEGVVYFVPFDDEHEYQVGRSEPSVGPFAALDAIRRQGTSLTRAMDWEYHRIWDAVGESYAAKIDLQQVLQGLEDL